MVSYRPVGIIGTSEPHQLKGLIRVLRPRMILLMKVMLSSTKTMFLSRRIAVSSLQIVLWLNNDSSIGMYQWYSNSANYKSAKVNCGIIPCWILATFS